MVLYTFFSCVSISAALLHRLILRKEKDAVLFVHRGMLRSRGLLEPIENLKKQGLFTDVCVSDWDIKPEVFKKDEAFAESEYLRIFDAAIADAGYKITDFEEIFVMSDSWDIDTAIYLKYQGDAILLDTAGDR
ncbi:MAG: hypothetical protein LBB94_00360 [Clostridiales bacterium]|nr:hypothetical protein [Clostridiales bacterium]